MRTADNVLSMRIEEGAAGYGLYCMLLELMRDASERRLVDNVKNLAFALNEPDVERLGRVMHEYGLFKTDEDGYLRSPWLDEVLQEMDAKKAAAVEAGKRGAAKRYGKSVTQSDTNSHPIATLTPPLLPPYDNKNNKNNETRENPPIQQSRSALLRMKWREYGGEFFFNLARGARTDITDMDRQAVMADLADLADKDDRSRNPGAILDCCETLHLSSEMLQFLLTLSGGGAIGTPVIQRLIQIARAYKDGSFRPKYTADYVLTQLVPLAVGAQTDNQ